MQTTWVFGTAKSGAERWFAKGTEYGIVRVNKRGWYAFRQVETGQVILFEEGKKLIYFESMGKAMDFIENFIDTLQKQGAYKASFVVKEAASTEKECEMCQTGYVHMHEVGDQWRWSFNREKRR